MLCKSIHSKKYLKTLKAINKSITYNVSDFLYLKSTQRKIGHLKDTTRTLEGHFAARRELKGHAGTRALETLGHSKGT